MTPPNRYFEAAGRWFEIPFGLFLLAPAGLFGYFGAIGAWAYLHGSRAAPADPLACGIGLGASVWLGHLAFRLIAGRHEGRPLLPNLFLLVAALGSLGGAIWFLVIAHELHEPFGQQLRLIEVFGFVGIAGVVLWWRRIHGRA
jgi:hypothetical protein